MAYLNIIVLVQFVLFQHGILCIVNTAEAWGRGPPRAPDNKWYMDALRCILSTTWEENGPFKYHCFDAICIV